jgi:hypothetical protein
LGTIGLAISGSRVASFLLFYCATLSSVTCGRLARKLGYERIDQSNEPRAGDGRYRRRRVVERGEVTIAFRLRKVSASGSVIMSRFTHNEHVTIGFDNHIKCPAGELVPVLVHTRGSEGNLDFPLRIDGDELRAPRSVAGCGLQLGHSGCVAAVVQGLYEVVHAGGDQNKEGEYRLQCVKILQVSDWSM